MKYFILFALFVTAVSCSSLYDRVPAELSGDVWNNFVDNEFEDFNARHGRFYDSEKDRLERRAIFHDNVRRLIKDPSDPPRTYEVGINEFSDWTHEEFLHLLGDKPVSEDDEFDFPPAPTHREDFMAMRQQTIDSSSSRVGAEDAKKIKIVPIVGMEQGVSASCVTNTDATIAEGTSTVISTCAVTQGNWFTAVWGKEAIQNKNYNCKPSSGPANPGAYKVFLLDQTNYDLAQASQPFDCGYEGCNTERKVCYDYPAKTNWRNTWRLTMKMPTSGTYRLMVQCITDDCGFNFNYDMDFSGDPDNMCLWITDSTECDNQISCTWSSGECVTYDDPTYVDWRGFGKVSPVKNQGMCGSCWAFSAVAMAESMWKMAGHDPLDISEQNVVDCETISYGCDGGFKQYGMQYLSSTDTYSSGGKLVGGNRENQYPYRMDNDTCTFLTNADARIFAQDGMYGTTSLGSLTEAQLATYVKANGPVMVSVDSSEWSPYSSGIFECSSASSTNHAVLVVGFSSTYWIIKNSWANTWGEDGYMRLKRGTNECNMVDGGSPPYGFTICYESESYCNGTCEITSGNMYDVPYEQCVCGADFHQEAGDLSCAYGPAPSSSAAKTGSSKVSSLSSSSSVDNPNLCRNKEPEGILKDYCYCDCCRGENCTLECAGGEFIGNEFECEECTSNWCTLQFPGPCPANNIVAAGDGNNVATCGSFASGLSVSIVMVVFLLFAGLILSH